jgi:hypothetical protein
MIHPPITSGGNKILGVKYGPKEKEEETSTP